MTNRPAIIGAWLIIALSAVVVLGSIYYCFQTLQLEPAAMRERFAITPDHPLTQLDDEALRWILVLSVALAVVEGVICGVIGILCLKQRRAGFVAGIVVSALRLVIALLGVLFGIVVMIADSMAAERKPGHGGGMVSIVASLISIPILVATIVSLLMALRRAKKIPPKLSHGSQPSITAA